MLLAIDMGNTQTAMGLFDGDELVQSWRMPTDRSYTADEIHVRLMGFFKMYDLSLDAVDAIAFAGVVPQLSREWHAVADRIAADAIVIGPQTTAVTKLRAARPQAVGADRIANAVAAETFYGAPAIVVDFGTATNIDVIDEDGSLRATVHNPAGVWIENRHIACSEQADLHPGEHIFIPGNDLSYVVVPRWQIVA